MAYMVELSNFNLKLTKNLNSINLFQGTGKPKT